MPYDDVESFIRRRQTILETIDVHICPYISESWLLLVAVFISHFYSYILNLNHKMKVYVIGFAVVNLFLLQLLDLVTITFHARFIRYL